MLNATYLSADAVHGGDGGSGDGALCDSVDAAYEQGWQLSSDARALGTPGVTFSTALCVTSVASLLFGARLAPLVAAVVAAFVSFSGTYAVIQHVSDLDCATVLVVAGVIGTLCVLAVACFARVALYTIGAACAASVVHLVFEALPELNRGLPQLRGRSIAYWGVLCAASALAGVVVRRHRRYVLEVATAVVGGVGLAFSIHAFTMGELRQRWLFVLVAGVSAALGWIFQRKMHSPGRCARSSRRNELAA